MAAAGETAAQLWHGLAPQTHRRHHGRPADTQKTSGLSSIGQSKTRLCFRLMKFGGRVQSGHSVLLDYAKGNKHQHELRLAQGIA